MTVRLFDVQAGFGGAKPGTQPVEAGELLAQMDRLQIDRALVRIAPTDLDTDALASNEMLLATAAESDGRLAPCPVVLPAGAGDVPDEAEQIDQLIAAGAVAAVVRPARDCWHLAEWASGPLFRALEQRRLPIVCLQSLVSLEQTAGLAEVYTHLPMIVAEAGYRDLRILTPLLERFSNVYLSTGSNFAVHRGIEHLVGTIGPDRLLFGSGFPAVEPMMAVTQLMYADISDADKQQIGSANLQRLIAEVQR